MLSVLPAVKVGYLLYGGSVYVGRDLTIHDDVGMPYMSEGVRRYLTSTIIHAVIRPHYANS